MIQLVPAKCPNCGAQLELDDNMKRAECSFCKSTIIVDDAIAKYKIEISGKVEVDGIKTFNQRIEDAKKYIKLDKFKEAKKLLDEVLKEDPFNEDAIYCWIRNIINYLYNNHFERLPLDTLPREDFPDLWNIISQLHEQYDKLKKLDESKNYEKKLEDCYDKAEYYFELYDKLLSDEKKCIEISEKVLGELQKNKDLNYYESWYNLLDYYFGYTSSTKRFDYKIWYAENKNYDKQYFVCQSFQFCRDGSITATFRNIEEYKIQPSKVVIYYKSSVVSNMEELINNSEDFIEKCKIGDLSIKKQDNNKSKKGLFSSIANRFKKDN